MDKKFLNKVVDQIISETMVNGETERIKTPFRHLTYSFTLHFQLPTVPFQPERLLFFFLLSPDTVKRYMD